MRPFHDGRHTALTNAAVAGNAPAAIQARAGHADFSTTQLYIDLAGVAFREEAEQAEARILGQVWVPGLGTDSPE
jgi:integrase